MQREARGRRGGEQVRGTAGQAGGQTGGQVGTLSVPRSLALLAQKLLPLLPSTLHRFLYRAHLRRHHLHCGVESTGADAGHRQGGVDAQAPSHCRQAGRQARGVAGSGAGRWARERLRVPRKRQDGPGTCTHAHTCTRTRTHSTHAPAPGSRATRSTTWPSVIDINSSTTCAQHVRVGGGTALGKEEWEGLQLCREGGYIQALGHAGGGGGRGRRVCPSVADATSVPQARAASPQPPA